MSPTFGAAKAENLLSGSKRWGCFMGVLPVNLIRGWTIVVKFGLTL